MAHWVEEFESYVSWPFKTRDAAKEYVAEKYKRQHGRNAFVLFHKTPLGLLLEVEDRIYIIKEDEL